MKGICFIESLHKKTVQKVKTQTRRIVTESVNLTVVNGKPTFLSKPRYNVGEILYLKEPYQYAKNTVTGEMIPFYKFDGEHIPGTEEFGDVEWKNKLFMPASAARYFIKIIGVRAERLQDISVEDCIKEGICQTDSIAEDHFEPVYENGYNATNKNNSTLCIQYDTPCEAYAALIDAINGKGTWERNPYVWVYDYEMVEDVLSYDYGDNAINFELTDKSI